MGEIEVKKLVIGTFLIYIYVTCSISLVSRVSTYFYNDKSILKELQIFTKKDLIWLMVVCIVIILLFIYYKKLFIGNIVNPFKDFNACMVAGTLILIDGIIDFSSIAPMNIMSITSIQDISLETKEIYTKIIVSNLLSIIFLLVQIIIGIYLIRRYKKISRKI